MDKQQKLEAFYSADSPWKQGVNRLRKMILKTELSEDWKWNFPTYTLKGKNVVAVASHKTHFGIWFFQGVFLKDEKKLLRNAQEGKTKAMRSLYFTDKSDINETIVSSYIQEAIQNSKEGKVVKIQRLSTPIIIPEVLQSALSKNPELRTSFEQCTPGKQREYAEHIGSAQQEVTQLRRLDKCIPMILEGIGLNDKYKKK
jgi:uncharacterized protein YdeI (YjbR/CyaY-like superfamily)